MKKMLLLAAASTVLATSAFAAKKDAKAATPDKLPCAVMTDHKVDIKEATSKKMFADYQGRRYFFCCAGCPDAFKKDPAKYAKAENSIPTPKK